MNGTRLLLHTFEFLNHLAQFAQGYILDLAHAFPGDAEFLAHILQRLFAAAIQAETIAQNGRFALVQRGWPSPSLGRPSRDPRQSRRQARISGGQETGEF